MKFFKRMKFDNIGNLSGWEGHFLLTKHRWRTVQKKEVRELERCAQKLARGVACCSTGIAWKNIGDVN